MTDLRTAAQQALEALHEADTFHRNLPDQRARRLAAMASLRAALAEPAPDWSICPACGGMASDPIVPQPPVEPVAWSHINGTSDTKWHPPQRKPLSVEEIMAVYTEFMLYEEGLTPSELQRIVRAVERAHGITP